MQKRSVVQSATPNGSFNSPNYGTFYKHDIVFANGDKGTYNSKSASQNKFVVGQEVDYDIEVANNPAHASKIKPVNSQQTAEFKSSGNNNAAIAEINAKLDAIINHFKISYSKPSTPAGTAIGSNGTGVNNPTIHTTTESIANGGITDDLPF